MFNPPIPPRGIIGYVVNGRSPLDQRERIGDALAAEGWDAVEEAAAAISGQRHGVARVRELARSSAVDTLVVANFRILFDSDASVQVFRRQMARDGVRVLALE